MRNGSDTIEFMMSLDRESLQLSNLEEAVEEAEGEEDE